MKIANNSIDLFVAFTNDYSKAMKVSMDLINRSIIYLYLSNTCYGCIITFQQGICSIF